MDNPRNELGDWLEGYLFDRRIVVLRGPLEDDTAARLSTELMTLDATGDSAVTLQLDSPGGPLGAAMTVVDVITLLGVPVTVMCMGRVEGSAVVVAACASERVALPHTRFRLSDPEVSFAARASQAEEMARSELSMLRRYHEALAGFSGQRIEDVEGWCGAGRYLSAIEAKELGLVDEVSGERPPLRRVR